MIWYGIVAHALFRLFKYSHGGHPPATPDPPGARREQAGRITTDETIYRSRKESSRAFRITT
eukprot:2397150-Pleurochrysis_carterae.AAC.1